MQNQNTLPKLLDQVRDRIRVKHYSIVSVQKRNMCSGSNGLLPDALASEQSQFKSC